MAVYIVELLDFPEDLGVSEEDSRHIHEFGKRRLRIFPVPLKQPVGADARAAGLQIRRGNAGRQPDFKRHREPFRGVKIEPEGILADDIRHLMGVADRRRNAMLEDLCLVFPRKQHRGLQVDMRVNESRHCEKPVAVEFTPSPVVAADAGYDALGVDRNVTRLHFARGQMEYPDISYDQRRGAFSAGDCYSFLEGHFWLAFNATFRFWGTQVNNA